MRWYLASLGPPVEEMLAAFADDWWMLSPSKSVQDSPSATDCAIASLPGTAVPPIKRMIYFDGFGGGSLSSLSGRRWMRTCGVPGRGGRSDQSILVSFVV